MTAAADTAATPAIVCVIGRRSGHPTIGHSRLPASRAAEWVAAGHTADDTAAAISESTGTPVTRAEVLTACWWHVRWRAWSGAPRWQRRMRRAWLAWADEHEDAMWRDAWDLVPDPPRIEATP